MKSIRLITILVGILAIISTVSLCINFHTYSDTSFKYLICLIITVALYATLQVIKALTRISDYLNLFKNL